METTPRGILVLRPSKRKALLLLAISLGFTVVGVLMIREGDGFDGWLVAVVFGLGLGVALVNLWPGASYLKLTARGMECRSLFRRWFYAWDTVSEFGVARITYWKKMVVFNSSGSSHPRLRAVNRAFVGTTDGLPETYGMKAEELADLLNEWRRYGSEQIQSD
ncbi:MAG TPA: hypothetical protein VEU96_07910 [Bryobacteraceae bacterium]|nr:hypothetical protein [Bryobacteraceae bacterium]